MATSERINAGILADRSTGLRIQHFVMLLSSAFGLARNVLILIHHTQGRVMEKGFIAHFERKVLFRIARFVAFTICFLLFLALVGGAAYLATSLNNSAEKPDPASVVQSIKPEPAPTAPDETASNAVQPPARSETEQLLRGVKLPPELQELLLDSANQRVFKDWLDELPQGERQSLIDGLGASVREARKNGVTDQDAINEFKEQYFEYVAGKGIAEAKANMERLYVAGAIVSILMLLALFSLVLVLLAIERNTRSTLTAEGRS